MSGGGGGGGDWRPEAKPKTGGASGGGGGQATVPDPCNIVETTVLNSPNKQVLASLRVGDFLSVSFEVGPPRRLLAKNKTGDVAGSITSPSMLQIIECINENNVQYIAVVQSIKGGTCEVRVQPA